jgi:phage terminase large subunit-like protein
VPFDYYAAECAAAKGQPSRQTAFRTLNLCQWVGQEKRAVDMREWEQNEHPIDLESLLEKPCFAGLDLSTTVSLTGFALAFPNEPEPGLYTVLVHHFLPDYDLQDKSYKARVDYPLWADAGWLTLIPGPAIQDEYVIEFIKEQMAKYSIIDCTFDRYGMVKIHHHLTDVGLPMIASGQDIKSMSYVCKEFERLIALHKLVVDDPMIKWQIDNLSWATDVAGNIKPDRLNSGSRIDGVVAMLMALDGAFRRGSRASVSVYDSYGPDSFFDMAEAEWKLAMKLKEEAEAEAGK